jgi:enterochelin esterase family protein
MTRGIFTTIFALIATITTLSAQQNLWQKEPLKSPEINADMSVTVRLYAPNAESVILVGDFVDNASMVRNAEGVW